MKMAFVLLDHLNFTADDLQQSFSHRPVARSKGFLSAHSGLDQSGVALHPGDFEG